MENKRRLVAQVMPWRAVAGTELATLRIAEAVKAQGFDSVMFCRDDAKVVSDFFASHGYETVLYDGDAFDKGGAHLAAETRRMVRALRRRRYSLVHGADLATLRAVGIAAKLAHCPYVCHVRNPYSWMPRLERMLLPTISAFVFVSQATRDAFGSKASFVKPLANRRGVVIYDGLTVDEKWLTREHIDHAKNVVKAEFG